MDFSHSVGKQTLKQQAVDLTDICKICFLKACTPPASRACGVPVVTRVVCDQGNAETSEVGSLGGFPAVLFVHSFITPVTITLLTCHITLLFAITLLQFAITLV